MEEYKKFGRLGRNISINLLPNVKRKKNMDLSRINWIKGKVVEFSKDRAGCLNKLLDL